MKKHYFWNPAFVLFISAFILFSAGCVSENQPADENKSDLSGSGYRTVVDSRGVEVEVPSDIKRVVTVSDGLIEGTMYALGVEDTLVGIGSSALQSEWTYSYPTDDGGFVNGSEGHHVIKELIGNIDEIPLFTQYGSAMNYETLSSLDPDVVIVRLGSCTFWEDTETAQKTIDMIDSLGIPLVVLYSPNCYDDASLSRISDEIEIIGDVFGKNPGLHLLRNVHQTFLKMKNRQFLCSVFPRHTVHREVQESCRASGLRNPT